VNTGGGFVAKQRKILRAKLLAQNFSSACIPISIRHCQKKIKQPEADLGAPSTHPIIGDELRALRRLQREQEPKSPFVFTSERGAPFTTAGFARMIERAGVEAKFGFKPHPHMLRHACGYALANRGHDTRALQAYLGHKNIQHTVRYTELSPNRFKNFWRE
jgi:type 1 fimbriae regulatory protein FimB/type 1 fimbriae regulatory protein FimE